MGFQLINRRVHLYLGMFLLPWVLMYAFSSLVFSHLRAIQAWDARGNVSFEIEWEKDLDLPVPENADLREFGPKILKEVGIETPFFASGGETRSIFCWWLSGSAGGSLTTSNKGRPCCGASSRAGIRY